MLAKIELARLNDDKFSRVIVVEKILEIVDIFISSSFLKQSDHLLAVCLYNLLKERKDATKELVKKLHILHYNISLKYAWLGCQTLQKSEQLIALKSREVYGVKPSKEELLKLQVYCNCVRLDTYIGQDFAGYENVFPSQYLRDASLTVSVAKTVRAWIKRGIDLAENYNLNRTPFICFMEDIISTEKKLRAEIKMKNVKPALIMSL